MNKIIGITTILALVTLPVVAQTKTLSPSPEITKIEPTNTSST